jgi:hypothetical protein
VLGSAKPPIPLLLYAAEATLIHPECVEEEFSEVGSIEKGRDSCFISPGPLRFVRVLGARTPALTLLLLLRIPSRGYK